jgi:hypothetical protein
MKKSWRTAILALLLLQVGSQGALSEEKLCGEPPPVADESLKGDIKGKAQVLSKFLGDASISGQIESTRKEIFSKYPSGERYDAYLQYQVCVFLMQDKAMSTEKKLEELRKMQREFRKPVGATGSSSTNQSVSGSGVAVGNSGSGAAVNNSGSGIAVGKVEGNVYFGQNESRPPRTVVQAAKEDAERSKREAISAGASAFQEELEQADKRYSEGEQAYQRNELSAAREIFSRSVQDFERLRVKALRAESERQRAESLSRPPPFQDPAVSSQKPSTYIWRQAGSYSVMQGVVNEGATITGLGGGNWTKYSDVDFGAQGARVFVVKVAAPEAGGEIDVYLDSMTVKPATRIRVKPTGSSTTFTYQYGTTPLVTNFHDVYLVYRGNNSGKLDAFGFTRTTPPELRLNQARNARRQVD